MSTEEKSIHNNYETEGPIHQTLLEKSFEGHLLCLPALTQPKCLRHTSFNKHQSSKKPPDTLEQVRFYLSSLFLSSFFLDFFQFSQKSCSVIIITVFQVLIFIIFLIATNRSKQQLLHFM